MAKKKPIEELKTAQGGINRATTGDGRKRMDTELRNQFGIPKRKKVL